MTRPIKFRGIDIDTGEFVFGEAVGSGNSIGRWVKVYGNWELRWYPVEPGSIAQLVGYDKDGKEVYEGDILVDELEQEYTAEIYDRPEKIHALKLKEAQP